MMDYQLIALMLGMVCFFFGWIVAGLRKEWWRKTKLDYFNERSGKFSGNSEEQGKPSREIYLKFLTCEVCGCIIDPRIAYTPCYCKIHSPEKKAKRDAMVDQFIQATEQNLNNIELNCNKFKEKIDKNAKCIQDMEKQIL